MADREVSGAVSNSVSRDVSGHVVQAGAVYGDVNLSTGIPIQTRYRHQVRRIAPPALVGRESELVELAEFCTSSSTSGRYRWWRAEAWSGKSALLSWFVLHPPAGVRVVSFFVTGRLSGQNDRSAFIDNVLEQLLALLGESLPPSLSESTKEGHLLGLLTEVADACRARGESFVLVLDGLDEDHGMHGGPDAHSIAALLPAELPEGMRVVVASRPNPPVPSDVPEYHPLHDDSIVCALAPSPRAQAIRGEMERELKRLLRGSELEQDLLGLVTAAGGGLTAEDLSELTGGSPYEVDDQLRTVTGRTFVRRDGQLRPTGSDIYLVGHEELHGTAMAMIRPARMAEHRARLHAWAEEYRSRGWPEGTPEYLLHGYARMLAGLPDPARLVNLATDRGRQDRLLDITGGDAAARVDIQTAQELVLRHDARNILAIVRLAVAREDLASRNERMPRRLPAVWATLGHPTRAESLARGIADRNGRAYALDHLVITLAAAGDHDRAERIAYTVDTPIWQAHALTELAKCVAHTGDMRRAATLAADAAVAIPHIDFADGRARAAAELARTMAALDQHDEAAELVDTALMEASTLAGSDLYATAQTPVAATVAALGDFSRAEQLLRNISDVADRSHALADLAHEAEAQGDRVRATALLAQAETTLCAVVDTGDRLEALAAVAKARSAFGDHDLSAALVDTMTSMAQTIEDPEARDWALVTVAEIAGVNGDIRLLDSIAVGMTYGDAYESVQRHLVKTALRNGDQSRAETAVGTINDPRERADALTDLAMSAGENGDLDTAAEFARLAEITMRQPTARARRYCLIELAKAVARVGDHDLADAIAHRALPLDGRIETIAALASMAATSGDSVRAVALADSAESLSRDIVDHDVREAVEFDLVKASTAARRFSHAQALAQQIDSPRRRAHALATLARQMTTSDPLAAASVVEQALAAVDAITTSIDERAEATQEVVKAVAASGDIDRALAIAETIPQPVRRDVAMRIVARATATAGEIDTAHALASKIADDYVYEDALADLAVELVDAGDHDAAEEIVGELGRSRCRSIVTARLAVAAATGGTWDRAEELLHALSELHERISLMTDLACVAAKEGDLVRAERLVTEALVNARWTVSLKALGQVAPAALMWIAQHMLSSVTDEALSNPALA